MESYLDEIDHGGGMRTFTAATPRIAVSRAGFEPGLPLQRWGPEDLLAA
jgi:hypothetical protein